MVRKQDVRKQDGWTEIPGDWISGYKGHGYEDEQAKLRCALSFCILVYIVSMLRASIISITRLFALRPNPLCSLIITTNRVTLSASDTM